MKASADFGEASGITKHGQVGHSRPVHVPGGQARFARDVRPGPARPFQAPDDPRPLRRGPPLQPATKRRMPRSSPARPTWSSTRSSQTCPNSPGTNNVWQRSSDYFGFNYNVTSLHERELGRLCAAALGRTRGDFRILSDSVFSFTITKRFWLGRDERDALVRQSPPCQRPTPTISASRTASPSLFSNPFLTSAGSRRKLWDPRPFWYLRGRYGSRRDRPARAASRRKSS